MRIPRTVDRTFWLLLVVSVLGFGCSGDRSNNAADKNPSPAAPPRVEDGSTVTASSGWVRSEDGKLSLRIVTAHGAIDADEQIPILAELRNDTDGTIAILWPFGDRYDAEATGIEIVGPSGPVRYTGPTAAYSLGANAFAHVGAGDILQDWLRLDEGNFAGIDATGRYSIRYTYRPTPAHRQTAEKFGVKDLWTGKIRTSAVTLTKKVAPGDDGDQSIENHVAIRIPKNEYRFTLDEVAEGVRFDYDVVIGKGLTEVIPLPQDAGSASGGGPSGLMPFEKISGNGQAYGLFDIGLGKPDFRPRTIEKGTHPQSFGWDGRKWGGPSDTSMPKGEPFPPGTYTLHIGVKGQVITPQGRRPYEISDTANVVLTP